MFLIRNELKVLLMAKLRAKPKAKPKARKRRHLLKMGLDVSFINQATGFSKEEIKQLASQ